MSNPSANDPLEIGGVLIEDGLADYVAALAESARACTDLVEAWLNLVSLSDEGWFVRTGLECAGVCHATMKPVSRTRGYDPSLTRSMLRACQAGTARCREACASRRARGDLDAASAQVCRRCEQACSRSELALTALLAATP